MAMSRVTIEQLRPLGIAHPRARDDSDLAAAVQVLVDQGATLDESRDHGILRTASARRLRARPGHGTDAAAAIAGVGVGVDEEFSQRLRLAMVSPPAPGSG